MNDISVDCNFPGGNILVDRVQGDTIEVHQDLRDTTIDWFYWYFRIRGSAGRTISVRFTTSDAIGTRGPAVSLDGGLSWRWLGLGSVEGQQFTFAVPAGSEEVRFSFGMPYQQSDYERFLKRHTGHPALKPDVLCQSRKGRAVEMLRVGHADGAARYHVLVTCRHHCCEMMASYSLEGMVERILDESATGAWLRQNVVFMFVPFMDKDGVEDGDQGKCRHPHDHNRDYAGESIYPEVAAVRKLAVPWAGGAPDWAFDLHCPWIKGFLNEFIYFVGGSDKALWKVTNAFSDVLAAVRRGPIPYYRENNLPFGIAWNTAVEPGRKSFAEWASELPDARGVSSIEIPYANASGAEVNPESARAFGRDLAEAIAAYLQIQS